MPCKVVVVACAVSAGIAAVSAGRANAQGLPPLHTFTPIPNDVTRGFAAHPTAFSTDASVLVGNFPRPGSPTYNNEGFRWTAAGGVQLLNMGEANAVSADGTIVGGSWNGRTFMARWRTVGGLQNLPHAPGSTEGEGVAMSRNGRIIAGIEHGTIGGAVWEQGVGTQFIQVPAPETQILRAQFTALSADGSVGVGRWDNYQAGGGGNNSMFRWTRAGGAVDLGEWQRPGFEGAPRLVSADGSVIVGSAFSGDVGPWSWTEFGGYQSLPVLPGVPLFQYEPRAMTPDASIVLGFLRNNIFEATGAFVMTGGQAYTLEDYLQQVHGVTVPGWEFLAASAISDDGRTIAGWGLNPDGVEQGWILAMPAPAAAWWLAGAGVALTSRRRRMGGRSRGSGA